MLIVANNAETGILGHLSRFWWWSLDHRGVPGSPGLVVILIPTGSKLDRVWGVAYGVRRDVWEDRVRDHLDHREKGGYTRHEAVFHPRDEGKGDGPKEVVVVN